MFVENVPVVVRFCQNALLMGLGFVSGELSLKAKAIPEDISHGCLESIWDMMNNLQNINYILTSFRVNAREENINSRVCRVSEVRWW